MRFYLIGFILLTINFCLSQTSKKQDQKSFYFYADIGITNIVYPDDEEKSLDWLSKDDGVTRLKFSFDMLGIYWHLNPKTLWGANINTSLDRFLFKDNSINIVHCMYSGSIIYYPGEKFHDGLFFRGDMGLTNKIMHYSVGDSKFSNIGIGVLAGSGWSFNLKKVIILLNLNYSYRYVDERKYQLFALTVGGLF